MDDARFDGLVRAFGRGTTRRRALGVLAMAAGLGEREVRAKGKPGRKGPGKKGKGKKGKACAKGTKKCGTRCIPLGNCCEDDDARFDRPRACPCLAEHCVNGRCECNEQLGYIFHNGICGWLPYIDGPDDDPNLRHALCLSKNMTAPGGNEECCSHETIPDTGEISICDAGRYKCLTDTDCVSGKCRGYHCPEYWITWDPACKTRMQP